MEKECKKMDVCICITEYSRNYHNIVNQLYFNKTLKTKKLQCYTKSKNKFNRGASLHSLWDSTNVKVGAQWWY